MSSNLHSLKIVHWDGGSEFDIGASHRSQCVTSKATVGKMREDVGLQEKEKSRQEKENRDINTLPI